MQVGPEICSTLYTTTSPKFGVQTSTFTDYDIDTVATVSTTHLQHRTKTLYPSTVTDTSTITTTFMYYATNAPTTTTVPTSPGFTPVTKAANGAVGSPKKQRRSQIRPRRSRKNKKVAERGAEASPAKSYHYSVICTTSTTISTTKHHTDYTTTTTTISAKTPSTSVVMTTQHDKSTSTIHVATATSFAACNPTEGNIIDKFEGLEVYGITAYGWGRPQCVVRRELLRPSFRGRGAITSGFLPRHFYVRGHTGVVLFWQPGSQRCMWPPRIPQRLFLGRLVFLCGQ